MHVRISCIFAPIIDPRSIERRDHFLITLPSICIGSTKSGKPMNMSNSVGSMWFATANQMMNPNETSISNGASATSESIVARIVCICVGSAQTRIIICPTSTLPKNSRDCLVTCSSISWRRSATACAPDQLRQ